MNPIEVTKHLRERLVSYLTTTFDVNRDGKQVELANALRMEFETPGALFRGPFLEMTPPYVRGQTLGQLAHEGIISPKLLGLDCFERGQPIPVDAHLYAHQEKSIRKITQEGHGVVVSSGTGSGKTESFLIPILNDLLIDPTPGVRAVLIYPLNALVNDQLDRLRSLLKGTEITFGRYTSELEDKTKDAERMFGTARLPNEIISREQIRKDMRLPQILITNYAMLEYLLLRPEDAPLFNAGRWRFLVLDEAHTYTGAKGIEVGMLIRRLKLRLGKNKGDLCCIATSATLTDDKQEAINFAENLFGEDFGEDDIIIGATDRNAVEMRADDELELTASHYLNPAVADVLETLKSTDSTINTEAVKKKLCEAGIISERIAARFEEYNDISSFLYTALLHNRHLNALRRLLLEEDQPLSLDEAAQKVFDNAVLTHHERIESLYRLIELGALARPASDQPPLLPVRYHLFARAPQGVWACINPECSGRSDYPSHVPWSKLYTTPHKECEACGSAVYPLAVCRTCGQVYFFGQFEHDQLLSEIEPNGVAKRRFYTCQPVTEDHRFIEDPDDEEPDPQADTFSTVGNDLKQECRRLCLKCRREMSRCKCDEPRIVTVYEVQRSEYNKRNGASRSVAVNNMEVCCRCHDRPKVKETDIATPITLSGNGPLGVLASELYRNLPPSTDEKIYRKPGAGRKLLTFTDSRQGAARFAAYLQDVFNQDLYRFMVPKAIKSLREKKERALDFNDVVDECVTLGWNELRIFQNDLETLEQTNVGTRSREKLTLRGLTGADRERLTEVVQARLMAEITTNRRSRQSLESLGLLTINYFERPPDVSELSGMIGMKEAQTLTLVRYLLHDLRSSKAVELPDGVDRDNVVFGSHKGNPAVVLTNPQPGREIPWIGKTPRQGRFQVTQRMLRHVGASADDDSVRTALQYIWTWLVEVSEVFVGSANVGYRLNPNQLFFSTPYKDWYRCESCQRIYHEGGAFPCPHRTCGGSLSPVSLIEFYERNYYFQVIANGIEPLRIEEHTAQLDPDKGRDYQNRFRDGDINVLSCSTTFEMGIDLGELQVVMLNNVPPTVSNYRQRSGRAGRRAGGTAFIVTWTTDQPHDQLYYGDPSQIIRGHVRVPRIHLDNQTIRNRHLNAVLMGEFLLHQSHITDAASLRSMGDFFDDQSVSGAHFKELSGWIQSHDPALRRLVRDFAALSDYSDAAKLEASINQFREALTNERERYREVSGYYRDAEERMSRAREHQKAEEYKKLLERLADERLIDTLSDHGLLPSYSFPLHTVELVLPLQKQADAKLRLQRDLSYAIREYAPGSEIVADKRLWTSAGLRFFRETPKSREFRLCEQCNHLQVADDAGMPVSGTHCPTCGQPYSGRSSGQFVTPDGFRADPKSGKPAGQYVHRAPSKMRSALLLKTQPDMERLGSYIEYGYSREGQLFYVNEGIGNGFRICKQCGTSVSASTKHCTGSHHGARCDGTDFEQWMLGHLVTTDTLHLHLPSTAYVKVSNHDPTFWNTLLYALIQGAVQALQLERRDIDGLLYPVGSANGEWETTIVLYDNVPGGAGHVRDIRDHFAEVVQSACAIVRDCDCAPDTSCIRCLRDYNNQHVYPQLQRERAVTYLELLNADLTQSNEDLGGAGRVSAINSMRWLMQQVSYARDEVWLAADRITDATGLTERESWLDLIDSLLRRNVKVTVVLTELPAPQRNDPESMALARRFLTLTERSTDLDLRLVDRLPEWQIIIDPDGERRRAVRLYRAGSLTLDVSSTTAALVTSPRPDIVRMALESMQACLATAQGIPTTSLETPPNVKIEHIRRSSRKHERDFDIIRDFFSKPVASIYIHDRYLYDEERLLNRVGAYIELALAYGNLERVTIKTGDAGHSERDRQTRAVEKLTKKYEKHGVQVNVERNATEHDRWIEITRLDGSKARMLIGRGLDFIRPNGSVEATWIVVEDPV